MKLIWSPIAIQRVEEIVDYIAFDKISAANKWVYDVIAKVELLQVSPKMGRVVPEIGVDSIREIIFGNYRIIYRYSRESINVLTVRRFSQILNTDDIEL